MPEEMKVIDMEESESRWSSFAEEVWATLRLIDVTEYITSKRIGNRDLEYLTWSSAWVRVMECFPESYFEFDDLHVFSNGTAEQWVTVTIKRGDDELSRRWWLPCLSHTNQPLQDPTSAQINFTRMRVLVKCLAMCGLGTELFSGEDIPDKEIDQDATGRKAEGSVLPPDQLFEGQGHIDTINRALPVDAIQTDSADRIKGYDHDKIDYNAIDDMLPEFDGKQELKLWVFQNIHKLQNRALRSYEKKKLKELDEKAAEE